MRYWWVNQNQTYRHEIQGGYLWSPKRNANGARNPFYESMREVAPGDLIFSFMDAQVIKFPVRRNAIAELRHTPRLGRSSTDGCETRGGSPVKAPFRALQDRHPSTRGKLS